MYDKAAVEAALFSASESLTAEQIAEKTGQTEEEVTVAIKALQDEYEERGSAITIIKVSHNYRMQLLDEYRDFTGKFSQVEMTRSKMKTVVTIAYNQPCLQSELCRTLGPRVYDDVRELIDMGLISGKPRNQSLELTTTPKFSEYFGIGSTRKDDIRKWIENSEKRRR